MSKFKQFVHFVGQIKGCWPSPHRGIYGVFLLIWLASMANALAPIQLQRTVDKLLVEPKHQTVLSGFVAYALLFVLGKLLAELKFILYSPWEQRILHQLYGKVLQDAFLRPIAQVPCMSPAEMTARVAKAVQGIKIVLFDSLCHFLPVLLESMWIVLCVGHLLDGWTALTVGCGMVLYGSVLLLSSRHLLSLQKPMRETTVVTQTVFADLLAHHSNIVWLVAEYYAQQLLAWQLRQAAVAQNRFFAARSYWGLLQALLISTIVVAVNGKTWLAYLSGQATLSSIMLLNAYVLQLLLPLQHLGVLYRSICQGFIDAQALSGLLAAPPIAPTAVAWAVNHCPAITLQNICLHNRLQRVSLAIPAGSKVFLQGASGSGKSSLLDVIAGVAVVDDGLVLFDARERVLPRQRLVYMDSNAKLYPGTVKENLFFNAQRSFSYGHTLELCQAFLLVADEVGFAALLASPVSALSLGQRQRLVLICRLLACSAPQLILLDEATNGLDRHTEQKVCQYLLQTYHCTLIFASHHTHLCTEFDCRVTLADGQIVAQASPNHPPLPLEEQLA